MEYLGVVRSQVISSKVVHLEVVCSDVVHWGVVCLGMGSDTPRSDTLRNDMLRNSEVVYILRYVRTGVVSLGVGARYIQEWYAGL